MERGKDIKKQNSWKKSENKQKLNDLKGWNFLFGKLFVF